MNTRELTIITAAVLIAGSVAISALAVEPENWTLPDVDLQGISDPAMSDAAGASIEDMAQVQGRSPPESAARGRLQE